MKKVKLPTWLPLRQVNQIFSLLNLHGESRLVGGCVRDILTHETSKDLDIATTVIPQTVLEVLNKNSIKAIPTGITHGTITAIMDNFIFEITTLRKDTECYGRHAIVEYTDNWKEDAKRRDFTLNAIFLDLEGNLYDYFNGENDLHHRLIKFIGDPEQRIIEDNLRILRYFRFYATLGGNNIDNNSLLATQANARYIEQLSGERIRQEMLKLLSQKYAKGAIILMLKHEIWKYLGCPCLNYESIEHMLFSNNPLVNLAALLRSSRNPEASLETILVRWRLSNKEKKTLQMLVTPKYEIYPEVSLSCKKALYFLDKEEFILQVKLKEVENPATNYSKVYELGHNFNIPPFPLNGRDIKKLGFQGEEIGIKLNSATNAWISSDFKLKKVELLKLIKNQQH